MPEASYRAIGKTNGTESPVSKTAKLHGIVAKVRVVPSLGSRDDFNYNIRGRGA